MKDYLKSLVTLSLFVCGILASSSIIIVMIGSAWLFGRVLQINPDYGILLMFLAVFLYLPMWPKVHKWAWKFVLDDIKKEREDELCAMHHPKWTPPRH